MITRSLLQDVASILPDLAKFCDEISIWFQWEELGSGQVLQQQRPRWWRRECGICPVGLVTALPPLGHPGCPTEHPGLGLALGHLLCSKNLLLVPYEGFWRVPPWVSCKCPLPLGGTEPPQRTSSNQKDNPSILAQKKKIKYKKKKANTNHRNSNLLPMFLH